MELDHLGGYTGKVLRIDLSEATTTVESIDEDVLRNYIGGVGIGIRILYDEVLPGTAWSDRENRLIFASGPLNGTIVPGSGTICAVTKGCLTNGGASSQANGYFGAYLKMAGFDIVIIQGASATWKYIYIHDGIAEIRDASHLIGKDTVETEQLLKEGLGGKPSDLSVYGIGPAGEHLVKFAMIFGDQGHVLAHNGFGAVMGSKRLKAIAVAKGKLIPALKDKQGLIRLCKQLNKQVIAHPLYGEIHKYGTSMLWPLLSEVGLLPVKNLTTNIFPNPERFSRQHYGNRYEMKRIRCWSCPLHHVQHLKIKEGPYAGLKTKDPEYECTASWGSLIGNEDVESAFALSDLADRLGVDSNEAGWTIAFAIECYEKGILTDEDTDGLDLTWGNVESVRELLLKIARREGLGKLLAEGVMRSAEHLGGDALNLGVYVKRGHSPRTHDARARWSDILDYTTGGVGTSESNSVSFDEPFLPKNVALSVSTGKIREFVDSLVVCDIATMSYRGTDVKNLIDALNLVVGWDYTAGEAGRMSLRVVNLLRVFNLRHGHTPDLEVPSTKYASTPIDGPMKGKSIVPHWKKILAEYYTQMGWDRSTGRPHPDTLEKLGLESVISDIW